MAAGCTVGRIPGDSGHKRAWGAGEKKEDVEGIRFYTLHVVEMRRGGRILPEKRAAAHCSEQASSPGWRRWAGASGGGSLVPRRVDLGGAGKRGRV
jgi:hypothetical protein